MIVLRGRKLQGKKFWRELLFMLLYRQSQGIGQAPKKCIGSRVKKIRTCRLLPHFSNAERRQEGIRDLQGRLYSRVLNICFRFMERLLVTHLFQGFYLTIRCIFPRRRNLKSLSRPANMRISEMVVLIGVIVSKRVKRVAILKR